MGYFGNVQLEWQVGRNVLFNDTLNTFNYGYMALEVRWNTNMFAILSKIYLFI